MWRHVVWWNQTTLRHIQKYIIYSHRRQNFRSHRQAAYSDVSSALFSVTFCTLQGDYLGACRIPFGCSGISSTCYTCQVSLRSFGPVKQSPIQSVCVTYRTTEQIPSPKLLLLLCICDVSSWLSWPVMTQWHCFLRRNGTCEMHMDQPVFTCDTYVKRRCVR
jgi:hypothetical protein